MRYEWDMSIAFAALTFVAGAVVGSAAGHRLGRGPVLRPPHPGPGQVPDPGGHLAALSPTHPALRRPPVYDWAKDPGA